MTRGSDEVLRDLLGLQEKIYRLFDEQTARVLGKREPVSAQWTPAVDIYDAGHAFVLAAELPGVDQADIHVEVADDVLVLRGERSPITPDTVPSYHRMERQNGIFQRVFRLPAGIAADAVSAAYRDGVLQVTVPKREREVARSVSVSVEE
ncbi:MAG: Hsp20/alpha crystallin family protein [Deferrisomatales bacterium]